MCDKRNKEKGKRKPGEHFHFCLFFLVGKINVVLKQQAHFRPGKLLETFGRNSLFSPIYLLWGKKDRWVDSKIRKSEKLPQVFFPPFCYFWADPSVFFFSKIRKWAEQNLGKFFTFSYFWIFRCPRHLAYISKNTTIFYMGSRNIVHMPDAS